MSSIVSSIIAHQVPSVIDRVVHALRMVMLHSAAQVQVRHDARRLADAMVVPGA